MKEGHAIMAPTDPGPRPAVSLLADPAGDLPRWRDRLERLWRRQVEEIIELSLAYHDTASADRGPASRARPRLHRTRDGGRRRWPASRPPITRWPRSRRRWPGSTRAATGSASSAGSDCERTGWRPARSSATVGDAVRRGPTAGIRAAARRPRTITIGNGRQRRGIMRRGLPGARTGLLAAGGGDW